VFIPFFTPSGPLDNFLLADLCADIRPQGFFCNTRKQLLGDANSNLQWHRFYFTPDLLQESREKLQILDFDLAHAKEATW